MDLPDARPATPSLPAPEGEHRHRGLDLECVLDRREEGAGDHAVAALVRMQSVIAEQRKVAVERGVDVHDRQVLGATDLEDAVVEHGDETRALPAPACRA